MQREILLTYTDHLSVPVVQLVQCVFVRVSEQ